MNPYVLGVDVWEGALDVDEASLKKGGVKFMIIRINDMNGGHHRDKNFTNQWAQAKDFIRWPYFVYNPWVSGEQNYNFLASIMPADATHISLDIEVRKPEYAPADYADQVWGNPEKGITGFLPLVGRRWPSNDVYTGGWFLPVLSRWSERVSYWWARYPILNDRFYYPNGRIMVTWAELNQQIAATSWNPGRTPGPCRVWQISGDRLILPGSADRPIDINIFNGTLAELEDYAGMKYPGGEEPPLPDGEQYVNYLPALFDWAQGQGYTGPRP